MGEEVTVTQRGEYYSEVECGDFKASIYRHILFTRSGKAEIEVGWASYGAVSPDRARQMAAAILKARATESSEQGRR